MEKSSKNDSLLGFILIVAFMVLIAIVAYLSPKAELPEETEEETPIEVVEDQGEEIEDDNGPKRIETTEVGKKEYTFEGQKYVFSFVKLDEYYDFDEGEIEYTSLVANLLKDDKTLFENLEVSSYIDEKNEKSDIKDSISSFMNDLSHFDDVNGKKYLLFTSYLTDGSGHTILDLDNKKVLFNYSHSDIGAYNQKTFKDLEKALNVDLSKYFENDRKSIIVNDNLIGYFEMNEDNNELDYITVQVKDGKLDVKKEVVKSNLSEEDFEAYCPTITTSLD